MLLSISSLWQQEASGPPPTVLYVRGGLLLALSSLLETEGIIIVVPPPVVPPPGFGGFGSRFDSSHLRRKLDDPDEEIVEIVAMIATIL